MLMSRRRVQIELSGILGILRTEEHFLVHILILTDMTTSDVKSLLRRECILFTIDNHHTVTQTAVHNADLTVVKEILFLDGIVNIES